MTAVRRGVSEEYVGDDYAQRLLRDVAGLNAKFPNGISPFQIVTRLCEEAGETGVDEVKASIDRSTARLRVDGYLSPPNE